MFSVIEADAKDHRGFHRRKEFDDFRFVIRYFVVSKNVSANIETTSTGLLSRKPDIARLRKVSNDPHEEISRR